MCLLAMAVWIPAAADDADSTNYVVERFITAQQTQREKLRNVEMDVEIEATVPKLAKSASLKALRAISKIGRVTYDALRFDGDNTVKKEVIARYLSTETQASEAPNPKIAINESNYKFKLKGLQTKEGRTVYVMELNPRRKEVGLFKGEVWMDPETFLTLREAGRFVKSPSVFIKKVEFVRNYEIRDGVSVPMNMSSFADTRIVGRTELNVTYSNFHKRAEEPLAEENAATLR
jgi:hypothetical protein